MKDGNFFNALKVGDFQAGVVTDSARPVVRERVEKNRGKADKFEADKKFRR